MKWQWGVLNVQQSGETIPECFPFLCQARDDDLEGQFEAVHGTVHRCTVLNIQGGGPGYEVFPRAWLWNQCICCLQSLFSAGLWWSLNLATAPGHIGILKIYIFHLQLVYSRDIHKRSSSLRHCWARSSDVPDRTTHRLASWDVCQATSESFR